MRGLKKMSKHFGVAGFGGLVYEEPKNGRFF